MIFNMKKLVALLFLFVIGGCSKSPSTFSIVCEGTSYFDEAYTFNFETGEVEMSKSLNAYGSEQKRLVFERLDSTAENEEANEDTSKAIKDLFSEDTKKMVIRNSSEGFITFGYIKEALDVLDMEWTLNRASLQLKTVYRIDKSAIPENSSMKTETVDFMDCKKPSV